MKQTFKVEGFKQAEANLLELSTKESLKIGRATLRKAARVLLVAWRSKVGVVSGRLQKALQIKVDRGRDRSWIFANVSVKRLRQYRVRRTERQSRVKGKLGPAKYNHQIGTTPEVYGAIDEFGAPARNIAPKGWLRSVWDQFGGAPLLDRIGKDLGEGLEQAAERMPK